MTCAETRERFLDLEDDSLDAAARAAVEEHLVRCDACRRELDRYRATVALLGAVERPRAPVGFVDRVMDRVRLRPWYRRLGALLLLPLPIKLPLEAAAIALVAIGVVYVFQHTPELQRAARTDDLARDREAPRAATSPAPSSGLASHPATAARTQAAESATAGTAAGGPAKATGTQTRQPSTSDARSQDGDVARPRELDRDRDAQAAGRRAVPERPTEANVEPEAHAPDERVTAPSVSVQRAAPTTGTESVPRVVAPVPGAPAGSTPTVAAPESAVEGATAPVPGARTESAPSVAAAPPSRFAAKADVASATGRLAVTDHAEGARAVEALARRYEATVVSRHEAPDGVVLELRLPRAVYRGFVGELPGLGHWTVDREPASLPDEPVIRIRVERGPERRPQTSDAP